MKRMLQMLLVVSAVAGLALGCGSKEETKPEGEPVAKTEEAAKPATDEANKPEAAKPAVDEAKKPEVKPEVKPAAKASPETAALKGIAVTILNAYKAKDIATMGQFAPADVHDMIKELKPGHEMYERMFDETNWRWKAAASWDGKIKGVRVDGDDEAWLKYADLEGDEIAVVKLKKKDGKWLFDDFSSPSKDRWAGWGEEK